MCDSGATRRRSYRRCVSTKQTALVRENSRNGSPKRTPAHRDILASNSSMGAQSGAGKPGSGRRHHSHADLAPRTWWRWVRSHIVTDETGARRIRGRRPSESQSRQMHRWSTGDSTSFWFADAWCVSFGLNINDYLAYARANRLKAWAARKPWFEDPMSSRDWEQVCRDWPLPPGETDIEEDAAPDQLDRAA